MDTLSAKRADATHGRLDIGLGQGLEPEVCRLHHLSSSRLGFALQRPNMAPDTEDNDEHQLVSVPGC